MQDFSDWQCTWILDCFVKLVSPLCVIIDLDSDSDGSHMSEHRCSIYQDM